MTSTDVTAATATSTTADDAGSGTGWWRDAVIYQVYIRSFADADGDGVGDVPGIRHRLSYLRDLGVDALWITPWYPSPWADGGYDVADYRDIDERFGGLAEGERLLREAHEHGLRVIVDLVPNHTSHDHVWFQAALAAGPGSPERERYWFRPGRGRDGELPPNDWRAVFGGPAWTRVTEPDGTPGQWYLHLFAAEQPDLNWSHPEVRDEFDDVLRFWLDRGVDGFRIDVAHALVKDPSLPDLGDDTDAIASMQALGEHPHWDRDEVLDVYRRWRGLLAEQDHDPVFVAEAWVGSPERLARYLGDDLLHTAFNFDYLTSAWDAVELRQVVEATLAAHRRVGAPPTWVLSNHDVPRVVTRLGRAETGLPQDRKHELYGTPVDLALGRRRARAAALMMLALPGGAYVYQGEELGLEEIEDLPEGLLQDPTWFRTEGEVRGRDGCRVPIPWSGSEPPFGFSPDGVAPWLPQPPAWSHATAAAQEGDPASMLELYRAALSIRRAHADLGVGELRWDEAPDGVLAFSRGDGFRCIVNLSDAEVALPQDATVLLASDEVGTGTLPADATVWLTPIAAAR